MIQSLFLVGYGKSGQLFINGEKVDTLPKDQPDTEGFVGLRVNHRLNLHIEDFGVEEST